MKVIKDKNSEEFSYAGNGMLNKPGYNSTASYSYSILVSEASYIGDYVDASFMISDCSKVVNLELDIGTPEEYKNSMHKIEILLNALAQCRQELIIAREEVVRRQEDYKKEKEKKKANETNKA